MGTNRAFGNVVAFVALLLGAYQAWTAVELPDLAATFAYATKGLEHYTMSLVHFVVWLRVEAALSAVAALALILGGAMVFTRKRAGRNLVTLGCLLVVAHTGIGWVVATRMLYWFREMGAAEEGFRWFDTPISPVPTALSLAVSVVIGILVLHPATRRRLDPLLIRTDIPLKK